MEYGIKCKNCQYFYRIKRLCRLLVYYFANVSDSVENGEKLVETAIKAFGRIGESRGILFNSFYFF